MKKTGMMFVGFFGILLAGVAGANVAGADVYKCANVYNGMRCDGVTSAGGSEWSVTCNETTVKGIAMCGGYLDSKSDVVSVVDSVAGAMCYCKMIKPAVSIWVQVTDIKGQDTCSNHCATACVDQFGGNQNAMRDTMLDSVVQ